MKEDTNRKRALAEVLSLDAWHDEFSKKTKQTIVHVDVVFKEGLIGGEPSSPIRFRLKLRRAEVVLIVPDGEPAKVDPRSVSRDSPSIAVKRTSTEKVSAKISKRASVQASLRADGATGSAGARLAAQSGSETDMTVAVSQNSAAMTVLHSLTADGNHSWEVRSSIGGALEGRPWSAKQEPRLTIVDTRANRDKGIRIRSQIRDRNTVCRYGYLDRKIE